MKTIINFSGVVVRRLHWLGLLFLCGHAMPTSVDELPPDLLNRLETTMARKLDLGNRSGTELLNSVVRVGPTVCIHGDDWASPIPHYKFEVFPELSFFRVRAFPTSPVPGEWLYLPIRDCAAAPKLYAIDDAGRLSIDKDFKDIVLAAASGLCGADVTQHHMSLMKVDLYFHYTVATQKRDKVSIQKEFPIEKINDQFNIAAFRLGARWNTYEGEGEEEAKGGVTDDDGLPTVDAEDLESEAGIRKILAQTHPKMKASFYLYDGEQIFGVFVDPGEPTKVLLLVAPFGSVLRMVYKENGKIKNLRRQDNEFTAIFREPKSGAPTGESYKGYLGTYMFVPPDGEINHEIRIMHRLGVWSLIASRSREGRWTGAMTKTDSFSKAHEKMTDQTTPAGNRRSAQRQLPEGPPHAKPGSAPQ